MSLLDHFHPPLEKRRHWESFHAAWATTIASNLNRGILPERFHAEPQAKLGGAIEIDMATFEEEREVIQDTNTGNGVATAVWAPPHAKLDVAVEFTDQDLFEVQVYDDGMHLTAVIEIVSPGNKDRPAARRSFAVKCSSYIGSGIFTIVIDVVTARHANLHENIAELLDGELLTTPWRSPSDLYVAAYRPIAAKDQKRLQVWLEPLTLGSALPTMPMWITETMVLPLDLDKSYRDACSGLRIRL